MSNSLLILMLILIAIPMFTAGFAFDAIRSRIYGNLPAYWHWTVFVGSFVVSGLSAGYIYGMLQ